jgi:hypothetical protein
MKVCAASYARAAHSKHRSLCMQQVKCACLTDSVYLHSMMMHSEQLDQNLMAKFRRTPQYTAACAEQQLMNAKLSAA